MIDPTWASPPEFNSALVKGGTGPLSWEQAALAYAAAAAEDEANAATLTSILGRVQGGWEGAAAEAHTAALEPLIAWFHELAVNGTASAAQISAAAEAIASAIAACPEPVAVETNRDIWRGLAATNFFGQNTPPMGIQDAEYLVMYFDAMLTRATSDVATEVATGALKLWEPPPVPVNLGSLGSSAANAVASAATAPVQAMDVVWRRGNDAAWDVILTTGAAGDAEQMAGDARPRTSAMSNAVQHKGPSDSNSNPFGQADQLGNGAQQAGQMGGQMSGILSSMTQVGPQAAQGLMQPATQVMQGPMQGFSSILSPMMNAANGGGAGSGLNAPMMPMNFATGTGNLAAGITRPAGLGGLGGGGGALGGLRLPGASFASALPGGEATARTVGGSAAGAAGGAAASSGPGMYGAPAHGARERTGADSANKYADAYALGGAVAEKAS